MDDFAVRSAGGPFKNLQFGLFRDETNRSVDHAKNSAAGVMTRKRAGGVKGLVLREKRVFLVFEDVDRPLDPLGADVENRAVGGKRVPTPNPGEVTLIVTLGYFAQGDRVRNPSVI